MGTDDLFHKRKAREAESLRRQAAKRAPYDVVLIVCEGAKTEPCYLEGLRGHLRLSNANIVIADKKTVTDPLSVVNFAIKEFNKDPCYDRVYCVFDKDKHTTYATALDKIRSTRLKKGATLHAITSIPCFEIWLLCIVSKIGFTEGKIQLRSDIETKTGMILIRPGDLVISGINAAKGAIAIHSEENTKPIAAMIHYGSYIPNKDRVDIKFLWWLLRSRTFRKLLLEYVPGGIKTELKAKRLLPIPIPLPRFSVQQRVVTRIEKLAARIKEARGLRQKAVEEAEALIQTELSTIFEKAEAKGWTSRHLGDYVCDDCYGTSEKATDDMSGIAILRMGNIQNGRLEARDLKYIHLKDKDRQKLVLRKGDILVNRTNSAELVGKCAVFDLEGEYAFASYLIRLRLDTKRAEPSLVALYINSPSGRAYMFSEKKQMTGQANVNATKLKALLIAHPSLPEQRRIIAYLNGLQTKVDSLKRLQNETAKEFDAMLPSVLDRAFRGEL